jgi:Fe-S cluster assembly protein SufB
LHIFELVKNQKEIPRKMSTELNSVEELAIQDYKYGFETIIDTDSIPKGLSEDVVRLISAKKQEPEWMLELRLKAYRYWLTLKEDPKWANITFPKIDFQNIIYYSAPKQKPALSSLNEVDPELLNTFEKLGISLEEQNV